MAQESRDTRSVVRSKEHKNCELNWLSRDTKVCFAWKGDILESPSEVVTACMTTSLQNEMASAPLGAYESDDVYILEGAEVAATASSTLENEMKKTGSRNSGSQAGAELGRQDPVETAPADVWAGMQACCVALASCTLGELRGKPG
jgi:hypothetical protein